LQLHPYWFRPFTELKDEIQAGHLHMEKTKHH
jgi:hypothetical protein